MVTVLAKRIIPCLDVQGGNVVKGINFLNVEYVGDPVELAKRYNDEGADELVFLDITATYENRKTMLDMVKKVAKQIFIPFTVGGGISSIEDIRAVLTAGADKISLNTAAVKNPALVQEAAERFGSQCVMVAIDVKRVEERWEVFIKGGKEPTGKGALDWARFVERLGAGEILLTSMDRDGTKEGYDVELMRVMSESLNIPLIASGGAGNLRTFQEVFTQGKADAALAASVFHYNKYTIGDVKKYLTENGVGVRL